MQNVNFPQCGSFFSTVQLDKEHSMIQDKVISLICRYSPWTVYSSSMIAVFIWFLHPFSLTAYQALHDPNLVSNLLNQASFVHTGAAGFTSALAASISSGSGVVTNQDSQVPSQTTPNLTSIFTHNQYPSQGHHRQPHADGSGSSQSADDLISRGAGVPIGQHYSNYQHQQQHSQLLNPISVARLISLNQQPISPISLSRSGKIGVTDLTAVGNPYNASVHTNSRTAHYQPQVQTNSQNAPATTVSCPSHAQSATGAGGSSTSTYYYPSSGISSRSAARHVVTAAPTASIIDGHTFVGRLAHGARGAGNAGRHSPHTSGINHRIAQLHLNQGDRSVQLILLQDINQVSEWLYLSCFSAFNDLENCCCLCLRLVVLIPSRPQCFAVWSKPFHNQSWT